jgi:site-specific DNA-methyltransferase (cytosine-N4-specific)
MDADPGALPEPVYTTPLGACHQGDALELLRAVPDDSVALVITSPPFALRRKKEYGNVAATEYVEWFWPFAVEIFRVLTPEGSFVLDMGPAWNRGTGTRSLFPYHLVLKLCERFHLVQECYWHNPSKLPTPAEWVTIRRTRVKDAVNTLWWFGKTTTPRADNRRVLKPYSRSMQRLFREGCKRARRPSQHEVAPSFERDNGGAIPSNLVEVANTTSRDPYLANCRAAGISPHPARFPAAIPEFFIRFLTEPGDLVLDPFAGSNTTGQVAQALERRWLAFEINGDYVAGSRLRFEIGPLTPTLLPPSTGGEGHSDSAPAVTAAE